jgi:hypothetical protein
MKCLKAMAQTHHPRYLKTVCSIAACCWVSACTSTFDPAVKAGHEEAKDRSALAQTQLRQPQNTVPLVSEDTTLRFTQKSIPFVRSSMLPTSIGNVTLRVPGRHNLSTVADLISNATGTKENVWQLGDDFANLQEKQAIRYVGTTENMTVFEQPSCVDNYWRVSNYIPGDSFLSVDYLFISNKRYKTALNY